MFLTKEEKESFIGQTFGGVKVIGIKAMPCRGSQQTFAICECLTCGNKEYCRPLTEVRLGNAKSCGCKKASCFTGYKEIRGTLWGSLQKGALGRGYKFEISIQDAWDLYEKQQRRCALSNLPISFGRTTRRREVTASLDRIDNKLGYVAGNIQWVHKMVNIMKSLFDQHYFIELCKRIADNNVTVLRIEDEAFLKFKYSCQNTTTTANKKSRDGWCWTAERDQQLLQLLEEKKSKRDIARFFNRSVESVDNRIYRLSIKDEEAIEDGHNAHYNIERYQNEGQKARAILLSQKRGFRKGADV